MAHSTMSGFLKVQLLSAPIKVYKAAEESKSKFNMLHGKCNGRVNQFLVCPTCDPELKTPITRSDTVKGYPNPDGSYTVLTADEIKALELHDKTIEVVQFIRSPRVDMRVLDGGTYFLGCDPKMPQDAYRLMFNALAAQSLLALAKYRANGREHMVLISADKELGVFVMETLYYSNELRAATEIPRPEAKPIDPKYLAMTNELIETMVADELDLTPYSDEYEERVRSLIAEKQANGGIAAPKAAPTTAPVIDLLALLKASVDAASSKKASAPAIAPAKKKAAGKR